MKRYKIIVVDDSAFMRKMIKDIIESDDSFQVIATARNGKEAVHMIHTMKPDAVTLDVEMPEMNGLEALKRIMSECPLPVLMISSLTQNGAQATIEALEYGAFDFVSKPSGSISLDIGVVGEELLAKLRHAVRSPKRSSSEVTAKLLDHASEHASSVPKSSIYSRTFQHVVAIGTSTGGPRALNEVITALPSDFPAPVLIVQHMPPKFTKSLAVRLDTISKVHVVEAEDGLTLQPGVVYIAPGGKHMTLERSSAGIYRISINEEEPVAGHRPSVDVLFQSLIPCRELKRHAVLMTGMGKDGALGMKHLKEAGAETTIAQDEETCIVYGMPKAAVELGVVDHLLPVQRIADQLIQIVNN